MERKQFIMLIIWFGLLVGIVGGLLASIGLLTMAFVLINEYLITSPHTIAFWGLIVFITGVIIAGIFYYIGEQYYYRK